MAKSLAQLGGGSGIRVVECHADEDLQNIEPEITPSEIVDLIENGVVVALKLLVNRYGIDFTVFAYYRGSTPAFGGLPATYTFTDLNIGTVGSKTITEWSITITETECRGTIEDITIP